MSVIIPESHRDLLVGSLVVTLMTTMPDSQPQGTVVWCRLYEGTIQISITKDTQKYTNILNNPKVSVLAVDTNEPFRYIEVRGEATLSAENAAEILTAIATEYGYPEYDVVTGADIRVIVTITPTAINTH